DATEYTVNGGQASTTLGTVEITAGEAPEKTAITSIALTVDTTNTVGTTLPTTATVGTVAPADAKTAVTATISWVKQGDESGDAPTTIEADSTYVGTITVNVSGDTYETTDATEYTVNGGQASTTLGTVEITAGEATKNG
ncbi:MAG: hypothetical protein K2N78_13060, partial [Oscillospiraceae bacterium]|nr:hypothetical protein [Oscillospiraceae bacterium]